MHQQADPRRVNVDRFIREHYNTGVRGRVREIAKALGMSEGAVRQRAQRMGLCRVIGRREWTQAEDAFVDEWMGHRSPKWIGTKLGRSENSVSSRIRRRGLSRVSAREHWTQEEVALGFGVVSSTVTRWTSIGWLKGHQDGGPYSTWHFTEESLMEFVRNHRLDFDLRKVDQCWFMDLVFPGPVGGS